jgi:cytochrome b involved in lipid metabolism
MKKILFVGVPVFLLIVGLGVYLAIKVNKSADQGSTSEAVSTKSIALAEISTHNSVSNCWMAIEGRVYDVTSFIPNHPGGEQILAGCGKDATSLFNARPNDGTSHSQNARDILVPFQIGVLAR